MTGVAEWRARAGLDGSQERGDASEPAPECRGFRWIGQPFTSCDGCGRPAWEHEGVMRLHDGAAITGVDSDVWELRPWAPGEAEAVERKWGRAGLDGSQ
jgi:hypothetical protein